MTRDRIDALAERLFAAAREERPDRELGARVERALGSSAGAVAGSGDGERARRAGRRPLLVRGLLAAIVCGGLASLLLLARARDAVIISAERAPSGMSAQPSALPSVEGVAGEERAPHEVPSAHEVRPGPAPPNEIHRSQPEAPAAPTTPTVEANSSPTGSAPRSTATSTPSRDVPRRGAPPAAAQAAPADERAAAPADERAAAPADERAAAPAPTPTLSNELGALKQIRQALRSGDGSAALALLDRYDSGEYGSSLALEASVLRVEALDSVGRRAEAEALARRFVRDNPDSPLAERAQRFIDRTAPARPASGARP